VSEIARTGARTAITHGEHRASGWTAGSGGDDLTAYANTSGIPIVDAVKPYLIGFDCRRRR